MSAIRSVLSAPKQVYRKIVSYPIRTGVITLLADQATKLAVRSFVPESAKHCLLSKYLCLQHLANEGGAFNTALEQTTTTKILFAAAMVSLAGLFVKAKPKIAKLSLSLILSGSLGNAVDRFFYGRVTDFIKIGSWFPFNLADAALYSGELLLLYECLFPQAGKQEIQEGPSRLSIIKNSFTRNILNTVGQTFLYGLLIYASFPFLTTGAALITALSLSLVRDLRHRGERMF